MDRSTLPRQLALLMVVSIATLLLLVGGFALLQRASDDGRPDPGVEVTRRPSAAAIPSAASPSGPSAAAIPSAAGSPATQATPDGSAQPSPAGPGASGSSGAASGAPTAVDPVILAAGDIADCDTPDDEATADLLDDLPGTILTLGDTVYPSATEATFAQCFDPSWGRHRDRIRPAAGNHDWDTGDLGAYLAYFGDAAVGEDGDPWYALEVGTWQVIVLASDCGRVDGCGPGSKQGRWLAETLARSDAECTLAAFHHPRFSSGEHGPTEAVAPFWEQLHAAGVDVVLNGHEHDYERFAPQDPEGREDRQGGIRQFIVGTGGVALRPFDRVAANSELRASIAHGVLGLTLRDGSYDWVFHAVDDVFEDRGTAFCT